MTKEKGSYLKSFLSKEIDEEENKKTSKVSATSKSSKSNSNKQASPIKLKGFKLPFNELMKQMEIYKEDFELSKHQNVRLTEENYQKLIQLKTTPLRMVHLVNLLIKVALESDDFQQYIKNTD